MRVFCYDSYEAVSRQAANIISAVVVGNPRAVLGLATGSTPVGAYRQLIERYRKGDLDFSEVTTVNLDEYCGLSSKDPQSYRQFMEQNLFCEINIDPARTFLPDGLADDLANECVAYDARIKALGGVDLQLLGIGHNGHIGFNEPSDAFDTGTHVATLSASTIEANARFFERRDQVPTRALTMGLRPILQAKKILLLAYGEEKMDILEKALTGPVTPEVPASILQMHPDLTVIYGPNKLKNLG